MNLEITGSTPSTSQDKDSTQGYKVPQQGSMVSFLPKRITETGKKAIDSKLMKLFTLDYQPFRVVEDKGFKEFVHALNLAYKLPSRSFISKTAIPAMYEVCLTKTKELVAAGTSFCITTDCWTSITTTSYMGVRLILSTTILS